MPDDENTDGSLLGVDLEGIGLTPSQLESIAAILDGDVDLDAYLPVDDEE